MKFQIKSSCIILLFLFFSSCLLGQKMQGLVVEKKSRLPIAFATVVYKVNGAQKGIITDVHGKFVLNNPQINQIDVSCLGYKNNQQNVNWQNQQSLIVVELERNELALDEVVVTTAYNPAIRIIRNVLKNKNDNNYKKYDFYKFKCYHKTLYDYKFPKDSAGFSRVDTAMFKTLNKTALLISETVSEVEKNGGKTVEEIVATLTSGFKQSPLVGQMNYMAFLNSMSFYDNSITLFKESGAEGQMETSFVSPLSDNCLTAYNFYLEDVYSQNSDSVFEISYFPKKGKRFNGLKGKMYIESSNFAITDIYAEPSEETLIEFKFRQQYTKQNGKWFPAKLEEEISFGGLMKSKSVPVFIVTAIVDSVSYDRADLKSQNSAYIERIKVNEQSLKNSRAIIAQIRRDTLSLREQQTYVTIDSISDKYSLESVVNYTIGNISKFAASKIEIPYVDIDISKIYTFNEYEGSRLGLGIYTNDDIIKNVSIGGYFGYGFRDKKLKYGGKFEWIISKKRDFKFAYSYANDIFEVGTGFSTITNNYSLNTYLREYQSSRFENNERHLIQFEIRPYRFFKSSIGLSFNNLSPTYDYKFKGNELKNYIADEFLFTLTYAHGEQFSTIKNDKIVFKTGNPIVNLTYKRGINNFRQESLIYNKLEANVDFKLYNGRLGESKLILSAGLIDRSIPYALLFTGEGSAASNNIFSFVIDQTFQTMQPYEFLSDRYSNLFFKHNFGSLLFGINNFRPEFIFTQNSGWGMLSNPEDHSIDFKTKDKFFHESGLIVSNLLKLNYLNIFYIRLGVGAFYRYGYYSNSAPKDNFAFKLSFSVSYK